MLNTQEIKNLLSNLSSNGEVTAEEVIQLFTIAINLIQSVKEESKKFIVDETKVMDESRSSVLDSLSKVEATVTSLLAEAKNSIDQKISKATFNINDVRDQLIVMIDAAKKMTPSGDFLNPVYKEINDLRNLVNEYCDMEDSEDPELSPEEIRDSLETLEGDARLPIDAIEGLRELLSKLSSKENGNGFQVFGGSAGIQLYSNGTKRGTIKSLNLRAGSNMTLTYATVNGMPTITFSATGGGGGGSGFQQPTSGSINGINKVFDFATAPNALCIDDGRIIQQVASDGTVNWTGTTTITLAIAPIFDIFAVS